MKRQCKNSGFGAQSSPISQINISDVYFSTVIRILLIGSGNLAYRLSGALEQSKGVRLVGLRARDPEKLSGFPGAAPRSGLDEPAPDADICLLAVADRAIGDVAAGLKGSPALVVHCSGAQPLATLKGTSRHGVFYPLQTFSRDREVSLAGIPVLTEAGRPEDLALLNKLANTMGCSPQPANSDKRLALHLAAVFVNNFTNHMVYLGESVASGSGLDKDLFRPLLRETLAKLESLGPREAQTGPARRGDTATLAKHRELLRGKPAAAIYDQITESIISTYETEL